MKNQITLNRLLTLTVLLCGAGASSPAYGQYIYSVIESGSGMVWSNSITQIDPDDYYYAVSVSAELFDPGDNVLASGSDVEDTYAEVDLEVETGESGWFGVYGYHWAYDPSEEDWDPLGETDDYTYVYPSPGGSGPQPQINGISPQSGIYGEGDGWGAGGGYVPIYGVNFDPYNCACLDWVSFGTVEYVSDSQVNLYYDDGTPVGAYPIQLETVGGEYSNQVTFTIYGDPQPVITSISPSTWQAGQTTSFTITGTGFGTTPSLNITGAGIDNCDGIHNCWVSSSSDTGIIASVAVDANAPNETVTVTVASNGYWGYGFLPQQQGQSNQGNGTVQVQAQAVPVLTCTASVTRGGSATCQVAGASAGNVSWQFVGGGATVPGPSGTLTWGGTMVVSGTVTATVAGTGALQASITVTPRSWHIAPATPVQVSNGTIFALPSPPVPGQELGYFLENCCGSFAPPTAVGSGPNVGFLYVPSIAAGTTAQYEISPDLADQNSAFSQHQYGTYPVNPNGCISWANLDTQTNRHEYNSSTQSHWAFYVNSLNTNNPGDYLESAFAMPGTPISTFQGQLVTTAQAEVNQIGSDTAGNDMGEAGGTAASRPYAVNYDENDNLLGYINFGPNYANCN